jgi:hypothetical protein
MAVNASKALFVSITFLAIALAVLQIGNILYWGVDSLSKMSSLGIGITAILDIVFLTYIATSFVSGLTSPAEKQAG